jgi:hypothetical protein
MLFLFVCLKIFVPTGDPANDLIPLNIKLFNESQQKLPSLLKSYEILFLQCIFNFEVFNSTTYLFQQGTKIFGC